MARDAGRVITDNADADGPIEVWGFGLDWPAREPRLEGLGPGARTVDLDGEYGWHIGDDAEYIRGLGMIGPRGLAGVGDMSLDDWTVSTGLWRETNAFGGYQKNWLHYQDGNGTIADADHGYAQSTADLEPALRVWIWHMPPPPWHPDPAFVDIVLLGDGTAPAYTLRLPRWQGAGGAIWGDARTCRGPTLYGRPQGQPTWSLVDEVHDEAASAARSNLTQPELRMVTIEYDPGEGWLILRFDGRPEPHLFRGNFTDSLGRTVPCRLTKGPVGIRVCGHTALLNVRQLVYGSPVVICPAIRWDAPPNVQTVPTYAWLGSQPPQTDGTVTLDETDAGSRPTMTFTSENPAKRALLRRVQEARYPEFGAANSEPLSTEDGGTLQLMAMEGRCNDRYRGASLSATLEAAPGETLATVRMNQKVSAAVTADEGGTWTTLFTGYVSDDPEVFRDDSTGRETMRLSARDGIEARLPKKFLWGHPSFEAWYADEAFDYILQRAGVRGDQISFDPMVTGAHKVRLPIGVGDEQLLSFRAIERVETALDLIAELRGLEWGVGADGRYFLRRVLRHVAGASDLTLDIDSEDPEELVMAPFRVAKDFGEFANMFMLTVGQGWNSRGGWYWFPASILDPTSAAYVGEDWQVVENYPDGDSAKLIYEALWARRQELQQVVYWKTLGHADIMPGDEVKIINAGCGIPDNSIFRITHKAWRLEMGADNGVYSADYEGVLVEVGA